MVRLEEISSRELRRVMDSGVGTAVIPFGSVEYHGGHLPLGCDALLADVVGEIVAERLDAVLAPTVRVGWADPHMGGTGTLSVPTETLRGVAFSVGRSLFAHGFLVIALISTHGGNQAALEEAVQRLTEQYPDVVACAPRGDVGPAPGKHSGKWLTSVMLAVRPDLVDLESAGAELKDELRAATPDAGKENLERFVSAIVRLVRDEAQRHPSGAGP
jgi:creatinine amidohydrolase